MPLNPRSPIVNNSFLRLITQAEMAKMINVSQSTISQLENGIIEMSLVMLYSLIDHMGGELEITAVFDGKKVALSV